MEMAVQNWEKRSESERREVRESARVFLAEHVPACGGE
jgi:hypothetical protein